MGCNQCTLGYQGRLGIYEVVPIRARIGRLIMQEANAMDIDEAARQEGYPDLRRSGLEKVLEGLTSLEEINRVTKD